MELIDSKTAKILSQYQLYSQEEKGDDAIAVIKFFLPGTAWTWYVTEGERMENGDWHLFGLVTNPYEEKELGYFYLSQLEETFHMPVNINGVIVRVPVQVERDLYFKPTTLKKLYDL